VAAVGVEVKVEKVQVVAATLAAARMEAAEKKVLKWEMLHRQTTGNI
jgi:hypothetical protein